MGVQGLWTLLEPVGRRVNVETLSNQKVAVDASIWLIQFMKAMRDERGEMIRNAHVMGFFRRICRLLYHKIRPVFVFDGATPALKRATTAARRRRREQQGVRLKKTAEKLLLSQLKRHALDKALDNQSNTKPPDESKHGDQHKNPSVGKKPEEEAKKPVKKAMKEGYEENVEYVSSSDDDGEFLLPANVASVDPTVLSTLPPSIQLEVMEKMRESQTMDNREKFYSASKAPTNFSELQLQTYLQGCSFRRKMDSIKDKMNSAHTGLNKGKRIASEQNREYIFANLDSEDPAGILKETSNAGIEEKPDVDTNVDNSINNGGGIDLSIKVEVEGEKSISSDDMFGSEDTSASDVEWENAIEDKEVVNSDAKVSTPMHWRERASERQKFWSVNHGFKFGRKLGDWSQDGDIDNNIQEKKSGREIEEEDLQRAIEASLAGGNKEYGTDKEESDVSFVDVEDSKPEVKFSECMDEEEEEEEIMPSDIEHVQKEDSENGNVVQTSPMVDLRDDTKKEEKDVPEPNVKEKVIHLCSPKSEPILIDEKPSLEENADALASEEGSEDLLVLQGTNSKQRVEVDRADFTTEIQEDNELKELRKKGTDLPQVLGDQAQLQSDAVPQKQNVEHSKMSEEERIGIQKEINNVDAEIDVLTEEYRRTARYSEEPTAEMYAECQELLTMFGIPYIIAPMEAEAQCAFLNREGLVSGVLTDDSDAFLFGATIVYRNIFESKKYVEEYKVNDIERELALNRESLILMAMLLGSDYTEGVHGVGIVNAIEIINEFPGLDGLKAFKTWVETPDERLYKNKPNSTKEGDRSNSAFAKKHTSIRKNWDIPSGFPSEHVINEYRNPKVDVSKDSFRWGKPDLQHLLAFCAGKFGWSQEQSKEVLVPVLEAYEAQEMQLRIESFFGYSEKFAQIRSGRIAKAVSQLKKSKNGGAERPEDASEAVDAAKRKTNSTAKTTKRSKV